MMNFTPITKYNNVKGTSLHDGHYDLLVIFLEFY